MAAGAWPYHPAVTTRHVLGSLESGKDSHSAQEEKETQWRLSDGSKAPEQVQRQCSVHHTVPRSPEPAAVKTMIPTLAHTGSQAMDQLRKRLKRSIKNASPILGNARN